METDGGDRTVGCRIGEVRRTANHSDPDADGVGGHSAIKIQWLGFQKCDPPPDPTNWLAERISVDRDRENDIVKVSFQHSDPEVAANVTNAVTVSFFKLLQQESEGRGKRLLMALEGFREQTKREVQLQRDKLKASTSPSGEEESKVGTDDGGDNLRSNCRRWS